MTPKDHSAEDRLALAKVRLAASDRFIESIRSIEATQASDERKDANKLAKLEAFIKADRAKPVRDRIDLRASCFIGTAVVSPNPSDPKTSDTNDLDITEILNSPPTIN